MKNMVEEALQLLRKKRTEKKQLKLTRKSLAFQKKKLSNRESSLQESEIYKLVAEAKSSLLQVPGENESKLMEKLEQIGAEKTNVKGGSLAGAESRALVENLELPTLVYGEKTYKTPMGEVKIESEVLKVMQLKIR